MICLYGKRFLLFLVLSLLLSSPFLSAEVCLSDAEYDELTSIFNRLGNTLITQETQIEQLEAHLMTAEEKLAKSQNQIEMLNHSLDELKQSYAQQNAVALRRTITAAVISAVVGLAGGVTLVLVL
jgi:peptidoglycan hydrolase CwlO-like protein